MDNGPEEVDIKLLPNCERPQASLNRAMHTSETAEGFKDVNLLSRKKGLRMLACYVNLQSHRGVQGC